MNDMCRPTTAHPHPPTSPCCPDRTHCVSTTHYIACLVIFTLAARGGGFAASWPTPVLLLDFPNFCAEQWAWLNTSMRGGCGGRRIVAPLVDALISGQNLSCFDQWVAFRAAGWERWVWAGWPTLTYHTLREARLFTRETVIWAANNNTQSTSTWSDSVTELYWVWFTG